MDTLPDRDDRLMMPVDDGPTTDDASRLVDGAPAVAAYGDGTDWRCLQGSTLRARLGSGDQPIRGASLANERQRIGPRTLVPAMPSCQCPPGNFRTISAAPIVTYPEAI